MHIHLKSFLTYEEASSCVKQTQIINVRCNWQFERFGGIMQLFLKFIIFFNNYSHSTVIHSVNIFFFAICRGPSSCILIALIRTA